ncbi:alanine acetyltransferase [Megasphaera cerevisiae DSM 20462]|jgi:ribosomal-protein-alanine N-acetyltransferase|uniref:[Ribosomal protein bS18]-alanine N-acetyltransferase n=1 Tax=Megasphaera cerevisiae DSM 20462 TaxID=1122219 RepID=A0A0J6WPG1_9FIRM|nr:ribosomal protein S18-alanine N-acetyltransferase [Megasphaera cerevisiae]KMO85290.1 alanine acetyltransferase [Megasphaera cerevisiae DSM 20462]MCI1750403.1 ribosomal protein S18-alanine N-acetyltransferase [Megasphaera cerevisiae]OKY52438.1 ribosomal-protein-alanine N-acetyltransferase [Megasphaera cerevisiae]SKA24419.1 ribosomal-protein-alanine N-acetyltransferase [Megasphaera cerevisiae DSM 20462]
MIVRKAKMDDAVGIYAVEKETFSVPWSIESIFRELANEELTRYYVLEDETKSIVGYAGLWRVTDEGQITNIALCKCCRRNGYGELLLRVLMEAAWEDGCNDIFLEVRISNMPALHLYRKLGYTVLSVRKNYYSKPLEDAYVMNCRKENYRRIIR